MTRNTIALVLSLALAAPAGGMAGGAERARAALARHVVIIVGGHTGCTGTAIARDLVLTAAHCIVPGARQSVIESGPLRRAKPNRIVNSTRHPNFDLEAGLARRDTVDVALIKLAEPLGAKMSPAPLGTRDYFPIGDRFIVAGYGITGLHAGGFGTLRASVLAVMPYPASGAVRLADPVTRGETPGLGACSGDSGGPVFESVSGALVGVVSWATDAQRKPGCGGFTGATPLARFREWLAETAEKMGSKVEP